MRATCGILTFQVAMVKKKQTGCGAIGPVQDTQAGGLQVQGLSEEQSEVKASLCDSMGLCLEIKSTKLAGNMA